MTGSMMSAVCLYHFWFGNYRFLSACFSLYRLCIGNLALAKQTAFW